MEDRISSLSDEVIFYILSFLPTKLAATTSTLSKRWKPLWLSLLTLNFDAQNFSNFNSLRNSVSSVFLSRDITLPVQSFHLRCSNASTSHSHDINRFVYAVSQRRIQNLNLELSLQVILPPSTFSCRTLVVLQLKNVKVKGLSKLVVNFPLLKTLHLSSVVFETMEDLSILLIECPILEELHAEYLNLNNLDISFAQKAVKKRFPYFPNLIRASITNASFYTKHPITFICRRTVQVLRVELDLQLSSCYRYPFYNLTCMELILKLKHCDKWLWLLELLKHCPKLQSLTIYEDYWNNGKDVVDNWKDPDIVPTCISIQLKTCLLKGYKYTECGLQFAKFIMQNAKVMNRMSIKSASSVSENVKHQMLKKLASATRASATCKLLID